MPHVLGLSRGVGRGVEIRVLPRVSAGEYPGIMLRALCGIFMIVSIETGGHSLRSGIPELSVYSCECSYNLGCSAAADTKPRGLSANSLCPSVKGFVWACLRSRFNHRYYLYHLRGLTGLGLVLFHPNIIILWLIHNWIGVGELVIDLHMQMLCWIHCYICLCCKCIMVLIYL